MTTIKDKLNDYRRVRYIGNHPKLKGKIGDSYFNDEYKTEAEWSDLFRPDGEEEWYRVREENIVTLRSKNNE